MKMGYQSMPKQKRSIIPARRLSAYSPGGRGFSLTIFSECSPNFSNATGNTPSPRLEVVPPSASGPCDSSIVSSRLSPFFFRMRRTYSAFGSVVALAAKERTTNCGCSTDLKRTGDFPGLNWDATLIPPKPPNFALPWMVAVWRSSGTNFPADESRPKNTSLKVGSGICWPTTTATARSGITRAIYLIAVTESNTRTSAPRTGELSNTR